MEILDGGILDGEETFRRTGRVEGLIGRFCTNTSSTSLAVRGL